MHTIVTRTAMLIAVVALALTAFVGAASAQDYTPSNPAIPFGGPFNVETGPAVPGGAFGFGSVNATPSADADDGTVGGTGGGLAVTGSEVSLPLLAGVGLLGTGGVVLVASRRRQS